MAVKFNIALRALVALCLAALCLTPLGCSSDDATLGVSFGSSAGASAASTSAEKAGQQNRQSQQGDPNAYAFRSNKQLKSHYYKHGKEMGFANKEDYEMAASRVATNPKSLHKTEKEDGDDVYYLEQTNEFVIVSTDGFIRTYFNPASGKAYFNRQ